MHPAYFAVRFRPDGPIEDWPASFVIVTAWQTTGETWPDARNREADRALRDELRASGVWARRLTGYDPDTGHAEPGWAAELSVETGCDLGLRYRQDAIYFVRGDALSVTHCDERRALVTVGTFRARLDRPA